MSQDIILKQAESEDELIQIADLAAKVFSRRSYFDFFQKVRKVQKEDFYFKPEFSFIAKDKNKVISHIGISVREVKFGESKIKLAGIADVCTNINYRGLGLSKKLMNMAISYMYDNDFSFSLLYGIPNYYHKYEYIESIPEVYFTIVRDRIKDTDLSLFSLEKGFDFSYLNDIKEMYENEYKNCNGIVQRPDKNFFYLTLVNNHFYYIKDKKANKIIGYFYAFDEYSSKFIIKELGVIDKIYYPVLLAFIKELSKNHGVYNIPFYIHPDSRISDLLKDQGASLTKEFRYIGQGGAMTRIVDMKILFEELKDELKNRIIKSQFYNKNFVIKFINIDDKKNIFLSYSDGELNVLDNIDNFDIEVNIDNRFFSRVIIGYWNFEKFYKFAHIENNINIEYIELLNKMFPEFNFYLLKTDYF